MRILLPLLYDSDNTMQVDGTLEVSRDELFKSLVRINLSGDDRTVAVSAAQLKAAIETLNSL